MYDTVDESDVLGQGTEELESAPKPSLETSHRSRPRSFSLVSSNQPRIAESILQRNSSHNATIVETYYQNTMLLPPTPESHSLPGQLLASTKRQRPLSYYGTTLSTTNTNMFVHQPDWKGNLESGEPLNRFGSMRLKSGQRPSSSHSEFLGPSPETRPPSLSFSVQSWSTGSQSQSQLSRLSSHRS